MPIYGVMDYIYAMYSSNNIICNEEPLGVFSNVYDKWQIKKKAIKIKRRLK